MNLTSLCDAVWERKWKFNQSGKDSLRNALKVAKLLGDPQPSEVTCSSLENVCSTMLATGSSGATVNRHMSAISYALHVAHRMGLVTSVIPMPEMQSERRRECVLTRDQVGEIQSHITSPRVQALITFLYDTGLRVKEALNLTWDDLSEDTISVRTLKGGQPRIITLTPRAKATLEKKDDIKVWEVSQDSLNWNFRIGRERSSLKGRTDVVPHTLRHSAASRLAAAGADVMLIKEYLGHRSVQTTMRYVHLNAERLSVASKILETT